MSFWLSLSARRAWIEMLEKLGTLLQMYVALRKESVDRNVFFRGVSLNYKESLSARRAWIEMWVLRKVPLLGIVALRKESVDRNNGRLGTIQHTQSLSARRAWIEIHKGAILRLWAWSLSARRAWIEMLA